MNDKLNSYVEFVLNLFLALYGSAAVIFAGLLIGYGTAEVIKLIWRSL